MTQDKNRGIPTGYKVKLTVKERLGLDTLLPEKAGRIGNQLIEDVTEKTKFTQKEMETLDLKLTPGPKGTTRWTWDSKKEKEKQIEFTKTEMLFLQKRADLLDDDEDIARAIWSLVKKLDVFRVKG